MLLKDHIATGDTMATTAGSLALDGMRAVRDSPVGLSFVAGAWTEAALIRMAYADEQATLHRKAPRFAARASV